MADPSQAGCALCAGTGYLVEQLLGRAAHARRCDCQSACPRCAESGYVLVPAGKSSIAQVCTCRHLDQRIALFNQIGIPAAVAKASFDTFREYSPEHARAKAAAADFARKFRGDQPTKGILLYGRPGAGKTHLLCATLRHLALESGVSARYVEFMLLLSEIKAGFSSNRGHLEVLRPLARVPVLAIDELGKERGTEWERSMLDELISNRFNNGLTTLFATNYFPHGEPPREPEPASRMVKTRSAEFQREAEHMTLPQRVGDRIMSRLNEMCAFVKLDPGIDFRKDSSGAGSIWNS